MFSIYLIWKYMCINIIYLICLFFNNWYFVFEKHQKHRSSYYAVYDISSEGVSSPLNKRHLFLFIKTYHFSDIVCTYIFRYFMNYDYTLQFKQRFNFWHFLWYFSQGCFMLSDESAHWSYSTAWPVVMSRPSLVLKSALNSRDNVTDKHSSEWIFFRAEFVYFS